MRPRKTLTLRLTADMHHAVEVIAEASGCTMLAVISDAIDDYIEARKSDPEFQERLRARIQVELDLLDRLGSDVT